MFRFPSLKEASEAPDAHFHATASFLRFLEHAYVRAVALRLCAQTRISPSATRFACVPSPALMQSASRSRALVLDAPPRTSSLLRAVSPTYPHTPCPFRLAVIAYRVICARPLELVRLDAHPALPEAHATRRFPSSQLLRLVTNDLPELPVRCSAASHG